jgi:hypothetical protein
LYSARSVLDPGTLPLTSAECELFASAARWLDACISQPHPMLGRAGDVCPWTRRTLQLGRLFLASIPAQTEACIDACMLSLVAQFRAMRNAACTFDHFRAIVAVFPLLSEAEGGPAVVAAHTRLKPRVLRERMMLGEFYPSCEKPGLHARDFRPLRAPHALLVIREMVETDLWFLTDRDEFVNAYLEAFGPRGWQRLLELLAAPGERLAPERVSALRGHAILSGWLPP